MDSPEIALKRDLPTEEEKAGWTNKARSATITIATATSANPESYDIQLDGTADEVEINAAMQSLSGTGGKIVFGEGAVVTTGGGGGQFILCNVPNISLVGQNTSINGTLFSIGPGGTGTRRFSVENIVFNTSTVFVGDVTNTDVKIYNCKGNFTGLGAASTSGKVTMIGCSITSSTLGFAANAKANLMGCSFNSMYCSLSADTNGELTLIGCKGNEIVFDSGTPTKLIPPTASDIQKVNNITSIDYW